MSYLKRVLKSVWHFWFGPIELIRLRAFEICFTASFLAYFFVARFFYWEEWLTPAGYHYPRGATPSYLIDPFPLLSGWAALLLGAVAVAAGVSLCLGKWRRPASGVLFLAAVYIQNADALSAYALNVHYIVGFLVLFLSPGPSDPGNQSLSARQIGSAWPIRTLQVTLLLQLFTAGWCKLQIGDWWNHSDVLWTHLQGPYRNHLSAWMLRVIPMWGFTVMQWSAFIFELVAPVFLLFRWTRWIALIWGVGFVSFIALTMNDLVYFCLQLASYLILFLSAAELSRVHRSVSGWWALFRSRLPGKKEVEPSAP